MAVPQPAPGLMATRDANGDPLGILSTRSVVRTVLYGAGSQRRFTQEGPVMTDVWTGYLDQLGGRLKLLVEPWDETAAADVAKYLRKAMGPAFGETRTVYNRTNVATELTLDELIAYGLP